MAEKVGEIYYDVTLELDQMIKDQRRAQQHVDKTADSLQRLAPIAAAAKAALSGLAVMKVIDMADEWGQYASRIKQATKSTEEYTYVQERMLASANATFRSVQETRESFIQLSPVLREMGLSLGQSVDVIDTFSGLLVVNAASAEKAKGAQDALAKSLQKGKIDADAWMSIYSTLDSVVDLIAESSGKSGEEIRKMGAEGKLGIDMFVNALSDAGPKVAAQVKEMPTTVRDAMQSVVNGLQEYIGWSNQAHGITATIASAVTSLGKNFTALADVALVAVSAGLVRYVAGSTAAAIATAAKTAASVRATAAEVALARAEAAQTAVALAKTKALSAMTANTAQVTVATLAHEAAVKRVVAAEVAHTAASAALGGALRGLIAFMTGPVGIAVIAGIAAVSFFKMRDGAAAARTKVDELTGSIDSLTISMIQQNKIKARESIDALRKSATETASQVDLLEKHLSRLSKAKANPKEIDLIQNSLINARVDAEKASAALREMQDAGIQLANAESRRSPGANSQRVTRADPEVEKRLQAMRDEEALAKLTGSARVRLQAIQKLGENATASEQAEAEKLATSIYNLEAAQKKLGEASKKDKFDSKSYLLSLNADASVNELAKINADEQEALSKHQNMLKEKKLSTQEYEEGVTLIQKRYSNERAKLQDDELGMFIARAEEAQKARDDFTRQAEEMGNALTESVQTPLERLNAELLRYDSLLATGVITQQTHARASAEAKKEYEGALNQMDQFTVRFAENVQDQLGNTLYDSLTGDFDNIGKAWGQMLMRMMAQAAAADLSRALFGSRVSGGEGSGLMGSVLSSIGSLLSGRRANGGGVSAGSMYEVNERGVPELLTVGNKQLLMMAGQSGNVMPLDTGRMNVAAVPSPEGRTGSGGPNVEVRFEVNNYSSAKVQQRQETQTMPNGDVLKKFVLEVVGDSFMSGQGSAYRGAKQRFRLQD